MAEIVNPEAQLKLAKERYEVGDFHGAEVICRQLIELQRDNHVAMNILGLIAYRVAKYSDAKTLFERAANCYQREVAYWNNIGISLEAMGDLRKAEQYYKKALKLKADFAPAHYNLGNVYRDSGAIPDAIKSYQRAIALQPDYILAMNNLANLFREKGDLHNAELMLNKALQLNPDFFDGLLNLGNMRGDQNLDYEAIELYARALKNYPGRPEIHINLGGALIKVGRVEEGIDAYKTALSLNPGSPLAISPYLFSLNYHPELSAVEIFREHKKYGDLLCKSVTCFTQHQNTKDLGRKIRIGYVSADFRNHAVAHFLLPLLQWHDRVKFEIYCYSNNNLVDDVTKQIKRLSNCWVNIRNMTDEETVQKIHQDRIDILVDLSGHTAGNRLKVFACKPAPIQVTAIGYANTTGLLTVDYRISDEFMDPPGVTDSFHTEQLVRLKVAGAPFEPYKESPDIAPLPALTGKSFTFGCLNNLAKCNEKIISTWARILTKVPNSRMVIGNATELQLQEALLKTFNKFGVSADRIVLTPRLEMKEYLNLHNSIDLMLDTYPYGGGTTSLHSLWMGVPVVAWAGERMTSRTGIAILSNLQLSEFVAQDEAGYIKLAYDWANRLEELNHLRENMRKRFKSDSYDPKIITQLYESEFIKMWNVWVQGA